MHRLSCLGLTLALLLTGCSTVAEHNTPSPDGSAPQPLITSPVDLTPPAPQWGQQNYVTSFTDDSQPHPIFEPEYRLPLIENADNIPAYEAINDFYASALADLKASSAEIFAWALEDARTADTMGVEFQAFVDEELYEITLETSTRLSILRSHYSNAGGAYPSLYPIGDTFDLTTGQRLAFGDLFTIPPDQAAARLLEMVLALNDAGAYGGEPLPADLLKAGWSPERFYLTEDSMVYYFPDSELPRALGTPTFAVPYTELEDILRPWE